MNLDDLLDKATEIPSYQGFPTVDELVERIHEIADQHPDSASVRRIGTSRLGEPLLELVVGDGPANAVVFAAVHPNEPIGGLTALWLAEAMASDPTLRADLGYTWHIVPCIDPDGTRLNEGWFKGPFGRGFYGRRFYRPAPDEQVEWTFPFSYKRAYFDRMLPETVALMRLIDDTQPAFMCSLHNAEFGGVYYYLSRAADSTLYDLLHGLPEKLGVALDTGEPEVPFVTEYATAIYEMIDSRKQYDYIEGLGLDPAVREAGTSSAAYASKYGTLTLVSELPYWTNPQVDDDSPTEDVYADVVRQRAAGLRELHEVLSTGLAAISDEVATNSPFLRATRAFTPGMGRAAEREERRADDPGNQRPATVAERFGCLDLVHCFRLRYGGMLLRALDGELAIGNGTPTIRAEHAKLQALYDSWVAEAATTTAEVIPIEKLVGVQYAAILATARHALKA